MTDWAALMSLPHAGAYGAILVDPPWLKHGRVTPSRAPSLTMKPSGGTSRQSCPVTGPGRALFMGSHGPPC